MEKTRKGMPPAAADGTMIFRMRAPAYGWGVSRLRCLPRQNRRPAHPARRLSNSREGLGLRRDTDVIDYYARRCAGNRAELAKTQELLLAAAQAGGRQRRRAVPKGGRPLV